MFLNFIPRCEDDPTFWASVGWYGVLVVCTWMAIVYLRLGLRSVEWLFSRDRTDWVALWTKLFFAPFGSGHLYLLNGENEVLRSERACLVVLADEEGVNGSAYLVPRCELIQNGRITYHRCRPKKHTYAPTIVLVNGKQPVHRDLVGYHTGNFIFSARPIASGLLAALRQKDTKAEAALP